VDHYAYEKPMVIRLAEFVLISDAEISRIPDDIRDPDYRITPRPDLTKVPVTVIAAAVVLDVAPYGDVVFYMDKPARHHNIIHILAKEYPGKHADRKQGFLVGKQGDYEHLMDFADRETAAKIALDAKQVKNNNTLMAPPSLFSEDMW
jgi:hypothetical protein